MNQNEFNLNENNQQSSYTESYTPEMPSFDNFDIPPVEDKGKKFAEKIKAIFSSKAFFIATIAYTVMAGASVIAGSIDVFAILFTIGMWMAYSVAKRETPFKEMKFLSGVLKAYYIVAIIGIVFMFIAAALCIVFAPNVMTLDTELDAELDALENGDGGYVNLYMELDGESLEELEEMRGEIKNLGMSIADFLGIIMIVLGVILIVAAVVTIIINELFIRKLRKQLENSIDAIASNSEAELSLKGIGIWFIVIGVLTAISAVSTLVGSDIILAASEGASAVACFALASVLNSEQKSKTPDAPAGDQPLL